MALSATAVEGVIPAEPIGRDFARKQIERWCEACHKFVVWEREHIIKGNPSVEERDNHGTSLKWLLRFTRLLYAAVADPDFPDHSAVDMVEGTLRNLDSSWKMIYEPMADEEARKLLNEVFPGWNEP